MGRTADRAARQAEEQAAALLAEQLRARHLRRVRVELADGAATTLHVASYDAERTDLRVLRLRRRAPLESWCADHGVHDAIVGGFYVRPRGEPLGELRTRGIGRAHVPFTAPRARSRASCRRTAGR